MVTLLAAADPTSHILPHDLIHVGPFWITNHMIMAVVAAVLMILIFPYLFRRATADAPTGARNFFESILEFLRVEVFRPALKEHTDRFVPFLWTLFFFILFCNLLGFIPLGDILGLLSGGKLAHVGGTATGSISTNVALAISAFVMIHISGMIQIARDLIRGTYGHHGHHEEHSANGAPGHEAAIDLDHPRGEGLPADAPQQFTALANPTKHYGDDEFVGHRHAESDQGQLHNHGTEHGKGMNPAAAMLLAIPLYFWNFAPHPFRPQPGESPIGWLFDIPMWGMLLVLELIGAVIKPFALMIRLFANMIAGHLVLAVLASFIAGPLLVQLAIGVPVTVMSLLIRMLELFVAFLQAYIFTFLTTLFIASAVAPEH
ncbi:MAG: F0F1 ATP synthase subunit A [Bacillota bacterium]